MIRFVPNALTIGRLFLSVIFLWMVLISPEAENPTALLDGAFVMFLVAAITDIIDGHVARRFNVTSLPRDLAQMIERQRIVWIQLNSAL